jgi:integrase
VGTVFKKQVTRPLPPGAEIFTRKGERFARWKDRRGKTRTAPLTVGQDGSDRILTESPYYVAKYRDGAGVVQTVATGCRDEAAARSVLKELERRAELVKAGVMTAAQDAVARRLDEPLTDHLAAYADNMRARGLSGTHRQTTDAHLRRIVAECSFGTLKDFVREPFERWLLKLTDVGAAARTRNCYRDDLVTFCNWCVETNRLTDNPFAGIGKLNTDTDPRRQRRAMTEAELLRLLPVARERPLLDALTVRRGKRKGERFANVRPEVRERLDLLGRERALIYKTLVLTGLRKGELASLAVGQLHLDNPVPYLTLDAADEKNREGNDIALRDDLAADLRDWLACKLQRLQDETRERGEPIPARLPGDTPVFTVPAGLLRILNRDLRLAGIPKRDDRGRTLDVHALRTTFGTLLSKGGVAPRTAQAAMRHSDIKLTMGVYTDPRLLDVRGALDVLPLLPLAGGQAGGEAVRATGTEGGFRHGVCLVAPTVAPTVGVPGQKEAIPVKTAGDDRRGGSVKGVDVTATGDKGKDPLSSADSGPPLVGVTGLEPATSWS